MPLSVFLRYNAECEFSFFETFVSRIIKAPEILSSERIERRLFSAEAVIDVILGELPERESNLSENETSSSSVSVDLGILFPLIMATSMFSAI